MTRGARISAFPTPAVLPTTEADVVAAFAIEHAGRFMFDHARRQWRVFFGHAWHSDGDGAVVRALQAFLTARIGQAATLSDVADRDAQLKLLVRCLRACAIKQLVDLATNHAALATDGTMWDTKPLLVAVKNGVVDLETGTLRPGSPGDMLTFVAGAEFDATAACPTFEQFLSEVMPDQATRLVLWAAIGYTLSGLSVEHLLFLLFGVTRAGKSTLVRALEHAFGDLAATIAFASLTVTKARHGAEASPDIATLPGKRFVSASEVRTDGRFDEARIKSLTGGDTIVCRALYSRPFEYRPQFKLWLSVNDLPRASEDPAFWARCRVFPFRRSFLGHEDRTLDARLREEAPGILAWAVEGFHAYRSGGLQPSADMTAEAGRWRDDNDVIGQFIASVNTTGRVPVADLFGQYDTWANGERLGPRERMSRNAFGKAIARTFPTTRSNGKTFVTITSVQECSK